MISPIRRQAHATRLTIAAVLLATFGLLVVPSSSLAVYTHRFLSSFGSFSYVQGVAVDSSTGDVYVYDTGQGDVFKFDASGNPANFSSTATNAITEAGVTFEFGLSEIAVDNSSSPAKGDIYVANIEEKIVKIYSPAGQKIGELTENSGAPWGPVCGVAVDPSGNVYVGNAFGHIDKFAPTGNPVTDADYASSITTTSRLCNVGADSAGNAYARTEGRVTRFEASQFGSLSATGSTVDKTGDSMAVDPANDELYVDEQRKISQFGSEGEPFEQPVVTFGASGAGALSESSVGIAVSGYNHDIYVSSGEGTVNVFGPGVILPDVQTGEASNIQAGSATVSGTVNPSGVPVAECQVEYGLSASYGQSEACAESLAEIGQGSSSVPVHANLSGLAAGAVYHYRLVAANANGTVEGEDRTFNAPGPPSVLAHAPMSIARTEADVSAEINPNFSAVSYHVEYGTSTGYGQSTQETQPSTVTDNNYHTVAVHLAGLTPNMTYHYRLVVTNAYGTATGGDMTLTTYPASGVTTGGCANQAHREAQSAGSLPDCRAYEMVSPVEKNGTDVEGQPDMAAVDGNRFYFNSQGSFAGQPTTLAAEGSPYMATRHTDGWTTKGIALPNGRFTFREENYMGFDPNLSKGVIAWWENTRFGTYDPAAKPGYNLYLHDSETGSFGLLGSAGQPSEEGLNADEGFMWGTPDFGKLAIATNGGLTAGAPCPGYFVVCAWEWDHGALRLASVLPNGEPTTGSVGGSTSFRPFNCNFEHALSDDGSRLFFTTSGEKGQLYARENGVSTTLISGSERTLPGGTSGFAAHFQSAEAAHGDRVLFTTMNSLVDADTDETNDLYMYDYTKPAGHRLTLISQDMNPQAPEGAVVEHASSVPSSACGGVLGNSEDLRRVYFAAENQIVPGGPTAPGPKVYLWDGTGASPQVKYIATLTQSDERDWMAPAKEVREGALRQSRWSRDGRYLAFISRASLTGFENEGEENIYRYDAVTGSLDCVTCVSGQARGEVAFETAHFAENPVNHEPQNVSDNGKVFFQTTRALAVNDSNGQRDVYEYDGHLNLISKGTGTAPSSFLDATPSGSDAFFTTGDQLVGWDKDGNRDVYDARVEGGLPEPPSGTRPCEGEACLPAPAPPDDATPVSATFSGAGNVSVTGVAHRCKAGRVRVKQTCVKKKGTRRRKHRGHRRHTTRRHG